MTDFQREAKRRKWPAWALEEFEERAASPEPCAAHPWT